MTSASDSPADTIRCAAALMRKRADEATPGPWRASAKGDDMRVYATSVAWPMSAAWTTGLVTDARAMPDAMHIALSHPLAVLAAADLFDRVADEMETHRDGMRGLGLGALRPATANPIWEAALAAARAYLNETGSEANAATEEIAA